MIVLFQKSIALSGNSGSLYSTKLYMQRVIIISFSITSYSLQLRSTTLLFLLFVVIVTGTILQHTLQIYFDFIDVIPPECTLYECTIHFVV